MRARWRGCWCRTEQVAVTGWVLARVLGWPRRCQVGTQARRGVVGRKHGQKLQQRYEDNVAN